MEFRSWMDAKKEIKQNLCIGKNGIEKFDG
jgi:hypothetical protein